MLNAHIWDDGSGASLSGELVFSDHEKFRTLLTSLPSAAVPTVKLNLEDLTFIDSAGLGMLLLFREEAKKHGKEVALCNAANQVKRMIDISRFDALFRVE